jgi:hypothetical protein
MEEVIKMGEMPLEIEQALEETGWLARWEAKCEEIGRRKGGH